MPTLSDRQTAPATPIGKRTPSRRREVRVGASERRAGFACWLSGIAIARLGNHTLRRTDLTNGNDMAEHIRTDRLG